MEKIVKNTENKEKIIMLQWENMKDRLRIRIVNAGKAIRDAKYKHTLKRVHPGGLMQLVTVDMSADDSRNNSKCVVQMLGTDILPSYYNLDPGILFNNAAKNSARVDLPVLRRLNASVASFLTGVIPSNLLDGSDDAGDDKYFDNDTAADNAYVLTTASGTYGASVLAYHYDCGSILDRVAEVLGEDYYVIPSSIHELILMPVASCSHSTSKLQEMIRTINQTVVQQDDVLSNYLYRYNVEDRTFEIVI